MDWDQIAEEHAAVVRFVVGDLRDEILALGDALVSCIEQGGKVLVCGNGGSAADAQHLAAELVNRFLLERKPYASIALTTDSSVITSIGNDYSFDEIFSKQVEALGKSGDMFVGISTSGNSSNILKAMEVAKDQGIEAVALTGGSGGAMASLADRCISVSASSHTPRIQEGHLLIIHTLCEYVEAELHKKEQR